MCRRFVDIMVVEREVRKPGCKAIEIHGNEILQANLSELFNFLRTAQWKVVLNSLQSVFLVCGMFRNAKTSFLS